MRRDRRGRRPEWQVVVHYDQHVMSAVTLISDRHQHIERQLALEIEEPLRRVLVRDLRLLCADADARRAWHRRRGKLDRWEAVLQNQSRIDTVQRGAPDLDEVGRLIAVSR